MFAKVKTVNGTKKLIPLTGNSGGIPLGTWASFEGGVAPNEDWLEAGTTFDPAKYPFLFNMLGTNVVPERFDHSQLGDMEDISIPVNTATHLIVPYDGFIIIQNQANSQAYFYIKTPNATVRTYIFSNSSSYYQNTIPIRKGDEVYRIGSFGSTSVRYYKQHLFIKATPIAYESDANVVKDYVQTANSYSTEEKLTGGTWINGKPIYRKTMSGSWHIENTQSVIDSTTPFDELLRADIVGYHKANNVINMYIIPTRPINAYANLNGSKQLVAYTGTNDWITAITLEYTKTTDQATS